MNNARKDTENNNADLRRALGRMIHDSVPAVGWEQRVLDAVDRRCRRRRLLVRMSAFGAAAVAAVVAAVVFLPRNPAVSPLPAEAPAVVGEALPVVASVIGRPAEKPLAPAAPVPAPAPERERKPRVIIPDAAEYGAAEPSDLDIPIGEYIDDLLAMELIRNQELLTSITD